MSYGSEHDRKMRPEVLKTEVSLVQPLKTKPVAGEISVLFIFMKNAPSAESVRLSALICLSNPGKTAFLNTIMIIARVAASVQMSVLQMQLKFQILLQSDLTLAL